MPIFYLIFLNEKNVAYKKIKVIKYDLNIIFNIRISKI